MSRRFELIAVTVIVLLAGWLRMAWPELTEFKRDEAALYSLALDVAEFKTFHLRGIGSSVGLPNAPMSVYGFALPLFVWKSPLAATLFVGLANTLSVALAYAMVRRYWGVRAALIAALLYAVAPWAVIYSRKIWAQNLLPLFVTGFIFSALLAFVEGRRRWLIAHLALLAVIVQLHLSALAFIPLTILLLVVFRRRVDWRMMGWGMMIAALLCAPFIAYVFGEGAAALSGLAALVGRPAQLSADSLSLAALVTVGADVHSLAGPQAFREYLASVPDFTPLLYLGGALALGGWLYTLWHWRRPNGIRTTQDAGLIIAAWLGLPILFFTRHSTPVFPHYFILLFPAPFVLAGMFVDALLARFPVRSIQWVSVVALLGLAAAQVWSSISILNFVSSRATPGGFGMPLGQSLTVAELVRDAPDVVVVSAGDDPQVDEVPAVMAALLRDTPHRFVDGRTTAVLPANGDAKVVIWLAAEPFPTDAVYRAWGDVTQSVALRRGEGAVWILAPRDEPVPVPLPRAASALLSNGTEILGSGGTEREWQLWWLATGAQTGEGYTLFAHALDANGQRLAQADVPTYPVSGWRAGDRVVSFFPLDAKGVLIRAGMYGSQSLTPVEVLDANGNPTGQWLEFAAPQVVIPSEARNLYFGGRDSSLRSE